MSDDDGVINNNNGKHTLNASHSLPQIKKRKTCYTMEYGRDEVVVNNNNNDNREDENDDKLFKASSKTPDSIKYLCDISSICSSTTFLKSSIFLTSSNNFVFIISYLIFY